MDVDTLMAPAEIDPASIPELRDVDRTRVERVEPERDLEPILWPLGDRLNPWRPERVD